MGIGIFMINIANKSEAQVQTIKTQLESFMADKPDWDLASSEYHSRL